MTLRRTILERGSAAAGVRWAAMCRHDLREQGRRASGGWPGTISEARATVTTYFSAELRERGMHSLTAEEREWTARCAYAAARRDWLDHGDREEAEP